jgi:hypothetical protein
MNGKKKLANPLGVVMRCKNAEDVLGIKSRLPPYSAVILCEPNASEEVVNVATPLPFRVPVPSVVPLSLNVHVPVGVPPEPETVAVQVTVCPTNAGFGAQVSVVVVDDG